MTILLILLTVSTATVGGIVFIFSNTIMPALASLESRHGMHAMQRINTVILNRVFIPVWMGPGPLSLGASIWAMIHFEHPSSIWILTGSALYIGGLLVLTGCCNIPLNNQLDKTDLDAPDAGSTWKHYLAKWVPWNTIRTVATLLASTAFAIALAYH